MDTSARVLVVDREAVTADAIRAVLRSEPCITLYERDPNRAALIAASGLVDVVIADTRLDLTGLVAAVGASRSRVRLALMSSSESSMPRDYLLRRAHALVWKPLVAERLLALVRLLLPAAPKSREEAQA